MKIHQLSALVACLGLLIGALSCSGRTPPQDSDQARRITLPENETACINDGWEKVSLLVEGRQRDVLWKGPPGSWNGGSIIVLHGGGGSYTHWCYASHRIVKPQVEFSRMALTQGFGVFLLDSTDDIVTDANGRVCGKRFDSTVVDGRETNVDLPFIEEVILETIPSKRPAGSSASIFMTGESTGGFMTTLASTHFDNLITAFAPVASGDPYGTYFDCDPSLSPRESARGAGFDRETNKMVNQKDACVANEYPNEKEWETANPAHKPAFMTFHHEDDGMADISCREKASQLLEAHGYPNEGEFILPSRGWRGILAHFWQSEYNQPVLDFFARYSNP